MRIEHGEHILQVGGRIGADEQHAFSAVGKTGGNRTGGRGLSHAALAGEEQVLCQMELVKCKGFHQQHPSPQQQLPPQQLSCLPRTSCGSCSHSVNSSLVG